MDVWAMPLPATDAMVPAARIGVRQFLAGHPLAFDAELVASELVTNAVRYSRGPDITVEVMRKSDVVRIEVTDHGSHTAPRAGTSAYGDEGGRGLLLVNELAAEWGHKGVDDQWMTVWAELVVDTEGPR
ncbi:ATP-binding protein [Microtetraspora sp. AC03309]|uniref:ATP-binding protein n=1 Tax=Microtetraspora sp. AC03309 TaxID=2779376 RepID=UPI001E2AACFE|nr:ATP-binding protein [Microtetraspora sp. AC03309]MCC5574438.1 ATP-binding protein [Microtetraspora sp. AC03309]